MTEQPIFGTVCCFGDSIFDGARTGHVGVGEILGSMMPRAEGDRTEWLSYSRTVCGETMGQILRRAPAVTRELASEPGAHRLVILGGTNDCKIEHSASPVVEAVGMVAQVLAWAARRNVHPIVCTLPPLVIGPIPAFGPASLDRRAEFNDALRCGLTREPDGADYLCDLADIPESMLVDGVHLSADGIREVARRIASTIGRFYHA